MALLYSNHGGGCCGMRHISNFRHGDAQRPADQGTEDVEQLINTLATRREDTNGTKLQEVILSNQQTQNRPNLLAGLSRLGFVYTSAWMGNHGTPVHVFHRAKRRLRLSDANFYDRWTGELQGMVAGPDLGGDLPRFEEAERGRTAAVNRRRNDLEVGDRVRINSPTSLRNGEEHVIHGFRDNYDRYGYDRLPFDLAVLGEAGGRFTIVCSNLELVDAENAVTWERIERDDRFTVQEGDVFRATATTQSYDTGRQIAEGTELILRRVPGVSFNNTMRGSYHAYFVAPDGTQKDILFYRLERQVRRVVRPAGEPEAPLPVYRHQNNPNNDRPAAPPPVARREITNTLYFASFQNGKLSGPYTSLEELRAANPRVINCRIQNIYNDGSFEMGEPLRINA